MIFPAEKLKLKKTYQSGEVSGYKNEPLKCPKIQSIYGSLKFPDFPGDRCYTFGSFVSSIDGRIAFSDSPDGTLVARKNIRDPDGGSCDYWILNLLRAVSDAVLMGAKMLRKEQNLTGRIYDQDLIDQRIRDNRTEIPYHIIVSGSGENLPLDHRVIQSDEIPVLIVTTETGYSRIRREDRGKIKELTLDDRLDGKGSSLIQLGKEKRVDNSKLLPFLKRNGLHSLLIESPVFMGSLIAENLMDELYLNTSGLFIGGEGLPLGSGSTGFSSEKHPHTRLLTQHCHSDFFLYSRYRFHYD